MTYAQALARLKKTKEIRTDMLEPLGLSFEWFLRYAQLPEEAAEKVIPKVIAKLEEQK